MSSGIDALTNAVKTKIVATIGPASETTPMLCNLAHAGADVFRLNFAHGKWDWHTDVLKRVRADVSSAVRKPIPILQDLSGPKLRLGEIPGGSFACNFGEHVFFVKEPSINPGEFHCSYTGLVDDLSEGDNVLLADGSVALEVISKTKDKVEARVTLPGMVYSKQGIASPNAKLQLSGLTEKDLKDLDWSATNEVDFVGMSFVRRPDDIVRLRQELKDRNCTAHVVAKIEKAEALDCLDDIIRLTDVVMVARGDLGVEVDLARVPMLQKTIIQRCRALGVPVITATQMLESMRLSNRPTRAEVTDVANAILDGTDAIMLSAETASGQYPVEAVTMMNRIALETERNMPSSSVSMEAFQGSQGTLSEVVRATVQATGVLADQAHASLVIVTTRTGRAAIALSKQRYRTLTLGLSDDIAQVRRMALYWGVVPVYFPEPIDTVERVKKVTEWAKKEGLLTKGERVVYLLGASWSDSAHTTVMVQEVS
ncbi:MAG: pyruvate kinase [Planctomycetia bacterium]|nr:pyruvate kinase [Planctomycetia bacterium]